VHAFRITSALVLTGALVLGSAAVLAPAAGASNSSSSSSSTTKVTVPKPPTANLTLSETGSSLLYPLWNLWAPGYRAKYPNVTISTASTGSGTGISSALAGTAEIGASDAYLSPTETSQNKHAQNIPLAISSQVVAYNLTGVTKPLKLSGPVLAQIYQGKITKWNDSAIHNINQNVSLPATPIVTLHRADSSGDTFLFTSYLSKTDSNWSNTTAFGTTVNWPNAPGALGETGNSGMVTGCANTPGCIAYIGISYEGKIKTAGLHTALLKNHAGKYLAATTATIAAAAAGFVNKTPANGTISMINGSAKNGYPIINYEYAITINNQSSSQTAQAMRSVLAWAISPTGGNAPHFLNEVDFVPLPPKVAHQSEAQIKKIQ
jgi:phosphate transport system substrate-binding protein